MSDKKNQLLKKIQSLKEINGDEMTRPAVREVNNTWIEFFKQQLIELEENEI